MFLFCETANNPESNRTTKTDDEQDQANTPVPISGAYLTGTVVDQKGTPVVNASVFFQNTDRKTTSDELGAFKLEVAQASLKIDSESLGTLVVFKEGEQENLGSQIKQIDTTTSQDLGEIVAKPTGGIAGKVMLFQASHHIGIDVYIPGTSFMAKTDDNGKFLISSVPEGTWELRTEIDGYRAQELPVVEVVSKKVTNIEDIFLFVDTGVLGVLVLNDGAEKTTSAEVTAKLYYSPNAIAWRSSESPYFVNSNYQTLPAITDDRSYYSFSYSFQGSDGTKTLYVQFSDKNGIENTISSSIVLDRSNNSSNTDTSTSTSTDTGTDDDTPVVFNEAQTDPDPNTIYGPISLGGYTWYLSKANQNCNVVCSHKGGCNATAINDFSGRDGSDANCKALFDTMKINYMDATQMMEPDGVLNYLMGGEAIGCAQQTQINGEGASLVPFVGNIYRANEEADKTVCGASRDWSSRMCACNGT